MATTQLPPFCTLIEHVPGTFDEVATKVQDELKKHGFTLPTTINMQQSMKDKLGVDMKPYKIFGACVPKFAIKALSINPNIGVFMPCNVVVRQNEDDHISVAIVNPEMMGIVAQSDEMAAMAKEVGELLQQVAAAIRPQ